MPKSKYARRGRPSECWPCPDLEQAKTAVLNSLTSARGQRPYEDAIREFVAGYCSEPRLAFNRSVVSAIACTSSNAITRGHQVVCAATYAVV